MLVHRTDTQRGAAKLIEIQVSAQQSTERLASARVEDGTGVGIIIENEKQITEAVLKPSQILRLGQVEVRLEGDQTSATQKKTLDHTQVVPQGIKFEELGQLAKSGSPGFEKRSNTGTKVFIIVAIIVGVLIVGALLWVLLK